MSTKFGQYSIILGRKYPLRKDYLKFVINWLSLIADCNSNSNSKFNGCNIFFQADYVTACIKLLHLYLRTKLFVAYTHTKKLIN